MAAPLCSACVHACMQMDLGTEKDNSKRTVDGALATIGRVHENDFALSAVMAAPSCLSVRNLHPPQLRACTDQRKRQSHSTALRHVAAPASVAVPACSGGACCAVCPCASGNGSGCSCGSGCASATSVLRAAASLAALGVTHTSAVSAQSSMALQVKVQVKVKVKGSGGSAHRRWWMRMASTKVRIFT